MRTTRRIALATAGIAAVGSLVVPSSPALAVAPVCPPVPGSPAGNLVAVTGSDRGVYYRCQGDAPNAFRPLGGISTSAPSIVTTENNAYFLVAGRDHALYVRTTGLPWARADVNAYCIQPAMALKNATTITVACTGSTGQLYTADATFTDGQLPRWTAFRSLGGTISGGPALAVVNGAVQYYVVGTGNRVYENAAGTFNGYSQVGTMLCVDTPAVSVAPTTPTATVFLGCHGRLADDALYAANANAGAPGSWGSAASLGGLIQRVPAIVAGTDTNGAAVLHFYAMGSNDRLYQRQVLPAGPPWTLVGGVLRRGVGAAQLQPATP